MLGTLRHGGHHFEDLVFTVMERTILTIGTVSLTLALLLVIYFGIFLLR